MKKLQLFFYILGLIGVLVVEVFLKYKLPEEIEFPLLLIFLGFIYVPFLVGVLKNTEELEMDFSNFRFILGLVSYPIIVVGYVAYKIYSFFR